MKQITINSLLITICSLLITHYSTSQSGFKVDEAGVNRLPNASAVLDAEATTKGILIPQLALTATNVAAPVASPANSLLVFNTATAGTGTTAVTPGFYYWDTTSSIWVPILDVSKGSLIDSSEWVDGSLIGLTPGNVYSRKAFLNGDTNVIVGSGFYNGSIGIGVPSPSAKLHVKGFALFESNSGPRFTWQNTDGSKKAEFQINNSTLELTGAGNRFYINRNNSYNLSLQDGGGSVVIGKGATFPGRLTLQGLTADATANALLVSDSNVANGYNQLFVIRNDGNVGVGKDAPQTRFHVTNDQDATYDSAFVVTSEGRVGIGTISPSYDLHMLDASNTQFGQWIQNTNSTGNLASEILLVGQGSGKYGYLAYHNDSYSNALFPNLTPNTTLLYSTQDLVLNSGTTSHDIKFGNSVMANQSMVIKGNGRVGINVAVPATQLHVTGTSRFQGDGGVVLQTMSSDGLRGVDFSNGSTYMDFRTPFNRWFINRNQPTQLELNQGGGFVGIGNPNGALPARLSVYGSTDNATSNGFLVGDSNTIANTLFVVRNDGNVGVGRKAPQARFHVTIDQDGIFDSAVVVTSTSRLGVGTLVPSERLDVIGNIRASGNFISGATTLTVPDYVFETYFEGSSALNEAYQFKSLKEIEEFTKENKHLPGIPSAKEIKSKDQFNVTQSSLNNLEKIEELYLHLIEVNKEKDALKKEVEDLKIELKEIKDMLKNKE